MKSKKCKPAKSILAQKNRNPNKSYEFRFRCNCRFGIRLFRSIQGLHNQTQPYSIELVMVPMFNRSNREFIRSNPASPDRILTYMVEPMLTRSIQSSPSNPNPSDRIRSYKLEPNSNQTYLIGFGLIHPPQRPAAPPVAHHLPGLSLHPAPRCPRTLPTEPHIHPRAPLPAILEPTFPQRRPHPTSP